MWPLWLHALLSDYWGALHAEQAQAAITAAAAPHAKRYEYQSLLAELRAATRVLHPMAPPEPMEHIADDPAQAAAWFAAQGIRTVQAS